MDFVDSFCQNDLFCKKWGTHVPPFRGFFGGMNFFSKFVTGAVLEASLGAGLPPATGILANGAKLAVL